MRLCKQCVQLDTRPGIYFNDDGVCGACIWNEKKNTIDWKSREKELQEIAAHAKDTTQSSYDCVIGVSGGKDSTLQAITARDKLGLRCLLVNNEPEGITELGRTNIENLKNLGFDTLALRPNPQVLKKMIKRDFYKYLNPQRITEFSLYCSSFIIADQFNIPLVIQGENEALTLGTTGYPDGSDADAYTITSSNTFSKGWQDYLEEVEEKDLFMFHFNQEKMEKKGIRAIWLQYFYKNWSNDGNAKFAQSYGFQTRAENFDSSSVGTYTKYSQIDSDLIQVNQLLKYIKFGFGQCMDHASYDIRDGLITRKEAMDLVKKYDGKCSNEYILKFCNYIDISIDEFWNHANKFRGPMWIKDKEDNWYNTSEELLK